MTYQLTIKKEIAGEKNAHVLQGNDYFWRHLKPQLISLTYTKQDYQSGTF